MQQSSCRLEACTTPTFGWRNCGKTLKIPVLNEASGREAYGAVDGSELSPSHHDRFTLPSVNPVGCKLGGPTDGQDASKRKGCLMRIKFLFPFRQVRSLVTTLTELFQLFVQGSQRPGR